MLVSLSLYAYFGPEVQLPIISMIGVFSGIVMIVGGAPVRMVRRFLRGRVRRDD